MINLFLISHKLVSIPLWMYKDINDRINLVYINQLSPQRHLYCPKGPIMIRSINNRNEYDNLALETLLHFLEFKRSANVLVES